MLETKEKNKKSAVDTMIDWKYDPSKIEKKVDERPFSEHEITILKNFRF